MEESGGIFVWLNENRESGASDHAKKGDGEVTKKWILLDPVLTAG